MVMRKNRGLIWWRSCSGIFLKGLKILKQDSLPLPLNSIMDQLAVIKICYLQTRFHNTKVGYKDKYDFV
jgi:hypothetical protein